MTSAALGDRRKDDYVLFCEGVHSLAGLDLMQYRRGQMERRLRTFAERLGVPKLTDYLTLLRRDPNELERFLDRVTINVSQLWRNPDQWALLARQVLPELARNGRVKIWSAGCSYGAECYTIAAVCMECSPGVRVEVKGTDIDPRMIERARAGIFSLDDTRTVPKASLERWFEPVEKGWRAKAELRRLVSLERADLLTMAPPHQAYDLVLCRNVVIYFNEDVRDALHARLANSLRPGGYLIVGSTERIAATREMALTLAHPFTYRKD
jgi:chemotaxis protein methyltransferase CheR